MTPPVGHGRLTASGGGRGEHPPSHRTQDGVRPQGRVDGREAQLRCRQHLASYFRLDLLSDECRFRCPGWDAGDPLPGPGPDAERPVRQGVPAGVPEEHRRLGWVRASGEGEGFLRSTRRPDPYQAGQVCQRSDRAEVYRLEPQRYLRDLGAVFLPQGPIDVCDRRKKGRGDLPPDAQRQRGQQLRLRAPADRAGTCRRAVQRHSSQRQHHPDGDRDHPTA